MRTPGHALPTLLLVVLLGLVAVACGDDGGAGSDDSARDETSRTADSGDDAPTDDAPDLGTEEGAQARVQGSTAYATSQAQQACLDKLGFAPGPPPHGALITFEDGNGSRVIVAVDSDTAFEVANQAGTADAPANVNGAYVLVGDERKTAAALACLEAG